MMEEGLVTKEQKIEPKKRSRGRKRTTKAEDGDCPSASMIKTNVEVEVTKSKVSKPNLKSILKGGKSYSLVAETVIHLPQNDEEQLSSSTVAVEHEAQQNEQVKLAIVGLGNMGTAIARRLVSVGYDVSVWNRTPLSLERRDAFESAGAKVEDTVESLLNADIIFSCVINADAVKEILMSEQKLASLLDAGKGYVEMTTIDSEESKDIAECIKQKNCRYLEAQLDGTTVDAQMGKLTILGAGEKSLFDQCQPIFQHIGKFLYLGAVGCAVNANLVIKALKGGCYAIFGEAMTLADKLNVPRNVVLEAIKLNHCCPMFLENGPFSPGPEGKNALKKLQHAVALSVNNGFKIQHTLMLTSMANEVLKLAKNLGSGEDPKDRAVVYNCSDEDEA